MNVLGKTILEVVVGSTVHGTNVADGLEDLDLMRIDVENARNFIGFNPKNVNTFRTKPEGVRSEAGDTDLVIYGLRKYLNLVLSGNPTMLLALFAPVSHVRKITPEGEELRNMASRIVSRKVYMPFRGYMKQQHERLLGLRGQRRVTRPELVKAYGFDTKYAGHIVRLGMQGEEILSTGKITLPMPEEQRNEVIKVRTGGYSLSEVSELLLQAEERLDNAYEKSVLPEEPATGEVEWWMTQVYLQHWEKQ